MSFEPPRKPTRPPPIWGYAISIAAMAAIIGGAYLWLGGMPGPDGDAVKGILSEDFPPPGQEVVSRPERITIPAIGVDGPVLEMRLTNEGRWDADSIIGEVGHLQGTPYPGEGGNTVLAAHVTVPEGAYGPFKDLETMRPGQIVLLWARDGTLYTYEVFENKSVTANALEVIAPTEQPTLTLITCADWDEKQRGYLGRTVVVAHLQQVTSPS